MTTGLGARSDQRRYSRSGAAAGGDHMLALAHETSHFGHPPVRVLPSWVRDSAGMVSNGEPPGRGTSRVFDHYR